MDTKIPESDLYDAERKVLTAFREHEPTVSVAGANAKIRGDFLRGLFLGKYGDADYRGTCIVGANINDEFNMEFCETKFPLRFRGCTFAQEIKLRQLKCPELYFVDCTLKKGFDALYAKVAGGVLLCDKFNAAGAVWLAGTDIGGQLVCDGGSFQNKGGDALNAQGMKVAGGVFLRNGFNAAGAVSLSSADIGGHLECDGGSFQNKDGDALIAHNIKVAGGVFLRNGFNAAGAVWLAGADIGGQLACTGGSFQNQGKIALSAQGIKVAESVFLRDGFKSAGTVWLAGANIEGSLELKNCKLTRLLLAGANVSGEFNDDFGVYKDDQGGDIDLDIDGFRYHRLNVAKERVEDRLAWVGLMSKGDEFRPQPYEQLMKVYREMGHMNWARRVGFELEKKRHKQLRLNRDHKRFVVLGWAWWFWYWILRGTIGYGYKPFRAIMCWFAPLIAAGFVLFSGMLPCPDLGRAESDVCHCMAPSDAEVLLSPDWRVHGKLPKDYPDFDPIYYAVESALPVLPLGQTENWHPKTPLIRRVQGVITIIGALALTILASFGVGVLGPRWKDG